jgi:hypothetical protein
MENQLNSEKSYKNMNEEKTSKAKKLINEFVKNGHWFPIR